MENVLLLMQQVSFFHDADEPKLKKKKKEKTVILEFSNSTVKVAASAK